MILGRKGFLNYLKALGGSNVVKIAPSNGSASESQATEKGLRVVCGANTSYLPNGAWLTDKNRNGGNCQVRVSRNNAITPNLGSVELAEALARVIPFTEKGKEARPILQCVHFIQKDGKLTLIGCDGFRLAMISLDFEDGEASALIESSELSGLISALKRARRIRLSFEQKSDSEGGLISKWLVIDTEAISYKWRSVEGDFPDYNKVIPTEFTAQAHFDTRETLKACHSLSALWLDKENPIRITIDDNRVILETKEDRGKAIIEAETTGQVAIAVNANFLSQSLKALGGMTELKVKDAKSPMLFSTDGYQVLLMPMFMPESKAVAEAEAVAQEAEARAEAEAQTEAEGEAETETKTEAKPKRKGRKKDKHPEPQPETTPEEVVEPETQETREPVAVG